MVKNVKNPLGAGGRFLRDRDNAAHGIEPGVKAANVGNKGRQHTDGNLLPGHQPDAKGPDHQQADFSEQ